MKNIIKDAYRKYAAIDNSVRVSKFEYLLEYIVEAKVIPPTSLDIALGISFPTVVEADAVYSEGAPVLQLKGNYSYGETIALPYASMKTEHITLDLKKFVQINTARLYFTCNRFCISDAME